MSIIRALAPFMVFAAFVGVLLYALTPRGLAHLEDAPGLPLADKRPFGTGEEGR